MPQRQRPRLATLVAAAAAALAACARADPAGLQSLGCVQLDTSTESGSQVFSPNAPQVCANYCAQLGGATSSSTSSYMAVSEQ